MKIGILSLYGVPPVVNAQSYRVGKIAKYLRKYGHEITLITERQRNWQTFDQRLREDIEKFGRIDIMPLGAQIIPQYYQMTITMNLFFLPDSYFFFALGSLRRISKIIQEKGIDCLITSNSPSGYLIGSLMARKHKIKWVADMADLWVENPSFFVPTPIHAILQQSLERKVLSGAHKICYVADHWKEYLEKRYPTKPLIQVRNGYDPDEFTSPILSARHDDRLTFVFGGTIYSQSTTRFIEAFVRFLEKRPELKDKVRLKVFGQISPRKVNHLKDLIKDSPSIEIGGLIPHYGLIDEIRNSDYLVFCLGSKSAENYQPIPSRLPIYIGSGKRTIACCFKGTRMESMFKKLSCWHVADAENVDSMVSAFERAWEERNKGVDIGSVKQQEKEIEELKWERIVSQLESHLRD